MLVLLPITGSAQELEPRTYSNAPIGTNFLVGGYNYSSGSILFDPTVPITDVDAKINAYTLSAMRFFSLADRTANIGLGLPFYDAELSGNVDKDRKNINRSNFGDLRLRLGLNLLGNPATTIKDFKIREKKTSLGISTSLILPTGAYTSERLINAGNNRWAIKPELGITRQIDNFFVEASSGIWIFTDNNDYFGGTQRSQEEMLSLQLHLGYYLAKGTWIAFNSNYWQGGQTAINGIDNQDYQSNSRYGITFSTPLSQKYSIKLAWSNSLITRTGSEFDSFLVFLQYRWFD